MNVTSKWVVLAAAVMVMGAETAGAVSPPIMVNTSPSYGRHWMTVFTNDVNLVWDWSTNAAKARLDIVGMNGSFTKTFTKETASNYLWRAFAPGVPAAEDVYDLTLTFYTAGDVLVEAMTSRLAVVTGAFGAASVNADTNSPAWSKVKTNVVIPYDAVFAPAATNAMTAHLVIAQETVRVQTNALSDASGYVGWKIKNNGWGYGTFDLMLTFPGTAADALTAELMRPYDGTSFRLR